MSNHTFGPSSPESEDSISDLREQEGKSSSNARSTPGDDESSPNDSLESNSTTTLRLFEEGPEMPTSSAEDFPAKTSASPESALVSTEPEAVSSSSSLESQTSLTLLDAEDGSSWRTYRDFSPLTAAGTSGSSFKRWPTSGLLSPTGFSTRAFTESLNAAVECSLSDILEPTTHERFFLSRKAAQGVLNRAKRRGRKLPERLAVALAIVAGATTSTGGEHTSLSGLGSGGVDDNDAQAGRLICNFDWQAGAPKSDNEQSGGRGRKWIVRQGDYAGSLSSSRVDAVVIAAPLTSGSPPNSNQAGRRQEDDVNLVAFHVTQDPISETKFTPALSKEPSGALGDAQGAAAFSENERGEVVETDYMHQLTAGGGKPGQGYPDGRVALQVRRLTPTECERLQGFPDGWTAVDGPPTYAQAKNDSWRCKKGTPDSRRYAAMGDAVTVNVIKAIGSRIITNHRREN